MKEIGLFSKGIGLGLLGALVGTIIAIPVSLVKTSLFYSGRFCSPVFVLTDNVWLTSCGFMFFEGTLGICSASIFLGGALLGLLSLLITRSRNGTPKLRWSFLTSMFYVPLLFSVYFSQ
jgi:hypothetical protein